jgi:FdhD protein
VDKVVGWALLAGRLPLRRTVLQVSGRASFELVQKAAMAGIPVLSAVSAPSALAVELGEELGVTVVGFNRGDALNVYSCPERITAVSRPDPRPS